MNEALAKIHASDCALHNAPAFAPGLCDCGAGDWQPIETAPRDGTVLILTDGKRVGPGSYLKFDDWTGYTAALTMASPAQIVGMDDTPFPPPNIPEYWEETPTHWMPLPDPPS